MKRARIRVTAELITKLLKLPEGTAIVGSEYQAKDNLIIFDVHGAKCPECIEGGRSMIVPESQLSGD